MAALEKGGPTKPVEDIASSSDGAEATSQREIGTLGGRQAPTSLLVTGVVRGPTRRPLAATPTPSRLSPPLAATTAGSAEQVVLLRLAGLTTRSTATKAWQAISGALLSGTPAAVEGVTLAVHDCITL